MTQREQIARIAAQIGSSLMPDNDQWKHRFTVRSHTSDATYVVAQRRGDSSWGCSCWAWRRQRKCKHLADILGRLARLETQLGMDAAIVAMLTSARTAHLDLDVKAIKVKSTPRLRPLDI